MKTEPGGGWFAGGILALIAAGAVGLAGLIYGASGLPLVSTTLVIGLLFVPYFILGFAGPREFISHALAGRRSRLAGASALLIVPYLAYAFGTSTYSMSALFTLAFYLAVPTAIILLIKPTEKSISWLDGLAVLALWLPFDFRLIQGVWTWPGGIGGYAASSLVAVNLGLLLFLGWRRIEGIGYAFRLRLLDLQIASVNLAIFAVIAVPLATMIDFIEFRGTAPEPLNIFTSWITLLVFVALPEEFLFRGLIQNFLHHWLGKGWPVLILAAVIFGAAHLENDGFPNYRYFLLASIAGIFYGRAYLQSRNLMAPVAVHASVDAIWQAFFR